jgi:hypothetical protein
MSKSIDKEELLEYRAGVFLRIFLAIAFSSLVLLFDVKLILSAHPPPHTHLLRGFFLNHPRAWIFNEIVMTILYMTRISKLSG